MSIRESLQNHRMASIIVSVVVILAAGGYIIRSTFLGPSGSFKIPAKAYYTTDDGNSLFVDDASKVPPFDHNGQQAVRAMAFTCDGGQHHWVQYLEEHADDPSPQTPDLPGARPQGAKALLIKRPGDSKWVSQSESAAFSQICLPTVPPGMGAGPAEPWNPQ